MTDYRSGPVSVLAAPGKMQRTSAGACSHEFPPSSRTLGILTLGVGLGVAPGLSEGPWTYNSTATSLWAPCTTQRIGTATKVTCRSIVSNVTPSSFTWGSVGVDHFYETPPKMPADFATCTTSALVHVVPRISPISSAKLSREMDAIYDTCSGSNDRL